MLQILPATPPQISCYIYTDSVCLQRHVKDQMVKVRRIKKLIMMQRRWLRRTTGGYWSSFCMKQSGNTQVQQLQKAAESCRVFGWKRRMEICRSRLQLSPHAMQGRLLSVWPGVEALALCLHVEGRKDKVVDSNAETYWKNCWRHCSRKWGNKQCPWHNCG